MTARWEPLETAEEVVAAYGSGRRVEYWSPDFEQWEMSLYPEMAGTNISVRGFKYRAMIEDSK